jgi:hypothetical protein
MAKIQVARAARVAFMGACLAALPVVAGATEQGSQRRDARDTRQDTRQDSRDAKIDCRQENNKSNAACRQDKRATKQGGREQARDIKY